MKKRLTKIGIAIVLIFIIGMGIAGNYFYNVGINRSQEGPNLHGGGSSAAAASIEGSEEQQAKLAALMQWTDQQKFEIVQMKSYDGLTLKGRFLKNPHSNGKIVILAHGYKGSSEQMPGITKDYYDMGYDVLKPDARGHGMSEGTYIGYGWHDRKDYVDWINFLINEKKENTVFLHGFSMGAATVLMTSGENLPKEVKGIIADSGYTTVKAELSHQLKYLYHLPAFPLMEVTSVITKIRAGYTFEEASALESVKKNKLPLFIIHGDQDELVPTEMGTEIYQAASSEKDLWIVKGAGHTEAYTVAEEEYKRRLQNFLDRSIRK
ncbi:alpha/beta hydrolase [Neobacillus sp. 179-C4.2 HS]|uniref:Alpha/beta hydrolase n=1 Tax=Neobacillus driksii TaxID=3035913 RepID=A0ABV4YU15_9BACI|nr:alpha/beta hydrolase [Neobacillus sp. 179.-C4.2 HS]MDP5194050.1 alpha/beta hydrolase [Neobacillus sp. 179.-C4.2 HS]